MAAEPRLRAHESAEQLENVEWRGTEENQPKGNDRGEAYRPTGKKYSRIKPEMYRWKRKLVILSFLPAYFNPHTHTHTHKESRARHGGLCNDDVVTSHSMVSHHGEFKCWKPIR